MTVAFRSFSVAAYATGTSVSASSPSGLTAGDLMLAYFWLGSNKTVTPPDGWTQLGSSVAYSGAGSGYYAYAYYKISDGTETTPTFTWSGSTDHVMLIAAYSGVDNTTPFDTVTTSASGASTSMTAAGLTTTTANAMLAYVGLVWEFIGSATATSGWTSRYFNSGDNFGMQDKVLAASGASGDVTVSIPNNAWVVFLSALRPAGGATNAGSLVVTLPVLTASMTGQSINLGVLAARVPKMVAALSGTSRNTGTLNATTAKVTAAVTGNSLNVGTLTTALPLLTASINDTTVNTATMTVTLPPVTAVITGELLNPGALDATLPPITGSITGSMILTGLLTAILPLLRFHATTAKPRDITLTSTPLPERWATLALPERLTTTPLQPRWTSEEL